LKIRKVCTYELIQLENLDGTRPRGDMARLAKTFTDKEFDITFAPNGVGIILRKKNDSDIMSTFVIPFANIPYVVIDESTEHDNGTRDNSAVRRRAGVQKEADTTV